MLGQGWEEQIRGIKLGQGRVSWGTAVGAGAHSLAGDVPTLLVDHAGPVQAAAALIHMAPGPFEVGGAAALPGAISRQLARAEVLTVVRALAWGLGGMGRGEVHEGPP